MSAAMRLILRDISPDVAPDAVDPELSDGALSVGKAPESAVLAREGDRFTLTDKSRNGARVDGVDLGEGQRVPLRDGSHIVLGNRQFRAEIVGETPRATPGGTSGAMPTISAILADVAPRGETASGPLPGRREEEAFAPPPPQRHRERDVTIGYGAPPPTGAPILPPDWNTDFSSGTEHVAATATRVSVRTLGPRPGPEAPPPRAGRTTDEGFHAFLAGAGLRLGADDEDASLLLGRAGAMLAAAVDALAAAERDAQKLYADFDAEPPTAATASTAGLADLLLDPAGPDLLAGRLSALRAAQARWRQVATETIVAAESTGPQAVQARVDAQGASRFGGAEKRYWRAILAAHTGADGAPTTLRARLSTALRRSDG